MENIQVVGSKKSFWRGWAGMAVLAVVAVAVVLLLLNLQDVVNSVQGKLEAWKYQRLADKMAAPYKNDKYGGKTPEETFDLFLDALRKEDIELASKYFVIPKQKEWKGSLAEYKKQNLLANLVVELETSREDWQQEQNDGEVARFKYFYFLESQEEELPLGNGKTQKITRPAGRYSSEFLFEKYPSGVWKISRL